jgi:hypothetical protein
MSSMAEWYGWKSGLLDSFPMYIVAFFGFAARGAGEN